jgi:hypothetical protein
VDLPVSKRDETALSRGETERGSIDSKDYAMRIHRLTTVALDDGERFSTHVRTSGSNQSALKDPTFRMQVRELEIWENVAGQAPSVHAIGKRVRTNGSLTMHDARGTVELDRLPPSLATVARLAMAGKVPW